MDQRSFETVTSVSRETDSGALVGTYLVVWASCWASVRKRKRVSGDEGGSSDVSGTRQTGRRATKTRSTPKESEGRKTSVQTTERARTSTVTGVSVRTGFVGRRPRPLDSGRTQDGSFVRTRVLARTEAM